MYSDIVTGDSSGRKVVVGWSFFNTRADLLWLLTGKEADAALQGQQAVWESCGSRVWGLGTG